MTFDFAFIMEHYPELIDGILLTVAYSVLAIALGFIGGLLTALIRLRRIPMADVLLASFVEVIRNTPFPVQLFFLYFGLPNLGITIPGMACGILGLSLLAMAHASEVFRGGFRAVPDAAKVAAQALSMPSLAVLRYVELPIALRSVTRPMIGTAILVFKESSVLYLISIHEVLYTTVNLAAVNFRAPEMIAVMGVVYLGGGFLIAGLGKLLERHFNIANTI